MYLMNLYGLRSFSGSSVQTTWGMPASAKTVPTAWDLKDRSPTGAPVEVLGSL